MMTLFYVFEWFGSRRDLHVLTHSFPTRRSAYLVLDCALPLYHNNALTVSWSAMLGAGCTLALGRKFSATRFWDEIHRVHATAFCYIGELCRYLLNQDRKSVV